MADAFRLPQVLQLQFQRFGVWIKLFNLRLRCGFNLAVRTLKKYHMYCMVFDYEIIENH